MKKQFIINAEFLVEFECLAENSQEAMEQFQAEFEALKNSTDFKLDIAENIIIHKE